MEAQEKKNIPIWRFPEFLNDGEWEVKRLGEIADSFTGLTYSPNDVMEEGGTLVLRSSNIKNGVLSFDDNVYVKMDIPERAIVHVGDILICVRNGSKSLIGKSAIITKDADNMAFGAFMTVLRAKNGMNQLFLNHLWNSNMIQGQIVRNLGSTINQITNKDLNEYKVLVPPLAEQQRIAACLSAADEMLASTNVKLDQLKVYKKGLMQKLFPAKGKKLPELRFSEFEKDGEWEEKILEEVTKVVNRRNKSNRNLPIYSISNKDGFILQSEQFEGLDSVSRGYDTSLYKIVTSNTFAYNPARINVGSIGYSGNIKECLISSLYVCFKTTESVDDSFLMYFFGTSSFNQSVENNVEGGIRSYLFYENFSKIKIMLPSILEQKKIASCLKAVDEEINAISDKASELEKQKKGLMQKLFPITKNN